MDWIKFDPARWLEGTLNLTPEEKGVYIDLCMLFYARDGDLPDDAKLICRASGIRPQVWRRIKARLIEQRKLKINTSQTPAKLLPNSCETRLKEAQNFGETQRFRVQQRWKNKDLKIQRGNTNTTTTTVEETEGVSSTYPRKKPRRNPVPFPEEWRAGCPVEAKDFATAEGLDAQRLATEWQRFADHAAAHASRYVDWLAAWRNWVRSPFQRAPPPARPLTQSLKERRQEEWQDVRAELRRSIEEDERQASVGANLRLLRRPAGD